jgi:putative heme-binding domain-containing protein
VRGATCETARHTVEWGTNSDAEREPSTWLSKTLQWLVNLMRVASRCCIAILAISLLAGWSGVTRYAGQPLPAKTQTPAATASNALKIKKDFKVELVYAVPRETQGSWVNMCVDPKGRLIVSDQNGPLYRVTVPSLPGKPTDTKVDKLDIPLGGAHELLYAFDSLYVMVSEIINVGGTPVRRGLYRARSRDGGDTFERPELLRPLQAGTDKEHGPHAIVLSPDGKSLYVVCGNDVKLAAPLAGSLVPRLWGEDRLSSILSPYLNILAPSGCIYRIDPEGKDWVLVSCGMRNVFDIAFNHDGDLFGFDNDSQADMNTPWYRPTRIFMAASGSDFGFRNGSNVSPPRYVDTLPAVCDIGPGAPTSVAFGYGAKFPAKYQEALYLCDWSYGRIYAAHLAPDGSAYTAAVEEFIVGTPLPVTDLLVHPADGALYFTIGGRRTQSALFRVTYTGGEPVEPSRPDTTGTEARALRRRLEAFHGVSDPRAVASAWPHLDHEDRYIRFAARVAIEHQDVELWKDHALAETRPVAAINALLALVRAVGKDPVHHPRKANEPVPGVEMKAPLLAALEQIDWQKLNDSQRCDLLRVYLVLFSRLGAPDDTAGARIIRHLSPFFPAKSYELNADLCQVLVYLKAPDVAEKALQLLAKAPSQEEQMEYAKSLRSLDAGWTLDQRKQYFEWFHQAAGYKGGQRFQLSVNGIKKDAIATLTEQEKNQLADVLQVRVAVAKPLAKMRPIVKQWSINELTPIVESGLAKRDFDRGRRLFGEASCFACHHFDHEGGSQGPDLTFVAGRFNVRDLLESIVEPSKVIADQYVASVITLKSGKVITGRIVNLRGDALSVMTDMLSPFELTSVSAKEVESILPSAVSPMPAGLLAPFQADEILDLVAYLLSAGNRKHKMFQK